MAIGDRQGEGTLRDHFLGTARPVSVHYYRVVNRNKRHRPPPRRLAASMNARVRDSKQCLLVRRSRAFPLLHPLERFWKGLISYRGIALPRNQAVPDAVERQRPACSLEPKLGPGEVQRGLGRGASGGGRQRGAALVGIQQAAWAGSSWRKSNLSPSPFSRNETRQPASESSASQPFVVVIAISHPSPGWMPGGLVDGKKRRKGCVSRTRTAVEGNREVRVGVSCGSVPEKSWSIPFRLPMPRGRVGVLMKHSQSRVVVDAWR